MSAFKAGYANHMRLSGGFIPERREVEYYLDIADEIRDLTGQDEIHALTVIGAPADFFLRQIPGGGLDTSVDQY